MRKLNILHLCTDEKFIDRAINIFELAYPEQNIICVYSNGREISHINRKIDFNIKPKESFFGLDFCKVGHIDVIIIHSLSKNWFRTIERLDRNIPTVWLGWGYDYYDLMGDDDKWLLYETSLLNKKITRNRNIKQRVKNAILYSKSRRIRIIEKISYFSPVIPAEYNLIKKCRSWKSFPKQVEWNYGAAEKDLSSYIREVDDVSSIGNNVLVGNSSTSTNNHLEIFNVLKEIDLCGKKLVIPLNYGSKLYGQEVQSIAKIYFGDNADILSDYMPLEDYMDKIKSCGFVIMNHVRQQGVGNIISMVYFGAKIFLREENPTFNFLKDNGVIIHSVQELEKNPLLLSLPLAHKDVINNRLIISNIWSNAALLEKTKKLIAYLTN